MGLYRFIVSHPIAVWMVTLAAAVFGLVSLARLPLNLMPDISYPTLTVRTEYPGAAPEEVEAQVSRPIEEALATVEGLVSIESRSRAELSDVVLEFDWDTPMSQAAQNVREALQMTFFVDGVERPLLLRYDPSLDPILRVAVSGASELQLRTFAEQDLKRMLETLPGVAAVTVRGGLERRVWVEPREDWLAARGVSLAQLSAVLGSENVNMAGGMVREGENEYLIRTLNELKTLDELKQLNITRADGTRVRLGDVASIREGSADREVIARLDGKSAVEVEVFKEADANIVTVARTVKGALQGYGLPEGVTSHILDDQALFVERSLENLVNDGLLGALLCILVTFVFLRDWSTTLIISTAMPICLVFTFAVMHVQGVSLNLMSIGGLALGLSMVVDSGTVVVENIQRHIDAGLSRTEAAVRGTAEVAQAVFASVLTNIAVFFPIVFVEGIAGQIFGDLAMTVVFALIASLVVALVFVPMLAARTLQPGVPPARALDIPQSSIKNAWTDLRQPRRWWAWPYALLRFFFQLGLALMAVVFAVGTAWTFRLGLRVSAWGLGKLNRGSLWLADRFLSVYGVAEGRFAVWLLAALRHPGRVLAGAGALLVASFLVFSNIGAQLIPEVHQGRFTVELALPLGTPLTRTDAVISQVENEVRSLPGIDALYTVIGAERKASSSSDEGENTAKLLIEMSPGGDLESREAALMDAIRAKLTGFPNLDVHFQRPALFSFHTPLEVVLYGNNLTELRAASEAGVATLAALDGLIDVRSSLAPGYPEVQVRYDRERLQRLGLSVGDVGQAVRSKVQGTEATRITRGEERVEVTVRLLEDDRASLADLAAINVNPRLIPPIRLDTVAELIAGEGPSEVRRVDQRRAVVLSANLRSFNLAEAANEAEAALAAVMPSGVEFEVVGQNRELETSLRSLWMALALAVFLVYVIMASTFESLKDPFVILFSVPLALVGVAAGLAMSSTPISVMVFLGLIVLAGVVVANAIVLVDAINRLRAEGHSLDEAIRGAAAERLRPILITALNSVLGLAPLALGFGEGAEMQRPMAITVIFGLASSTFLTLVVVPVVYRTVERLIRPSPAETPVAETPA